MGIIDGFILTTTQGPTITIDGLSFILTTITINGFILTTNGPTITINGLWSIFATINGTVIIGCRRMIVIIGLTIGGSVHTTTNGPIIIGGREIFVIITFSINGWRTNIGE